MTAEPTMSTEMTHMRREIEEIPQAVARLLDGSGAVLTEAGRGIRERDPQFVVTVARGLAAATFCWAVQRPDPPIEYRGLFAGPSATRRFAAKTLDGSRSGNRTNRPPIRSRSGHRPVGRAE